MTSYALAATPAGARMSSLPVFEFVGVGCRVGVVRGGRFFRFRLVAVRPHRFSRLTGGGEAVVRKGEEVGAEVPDPLGERDGNDDEREAGLLVWGWGGWWVWIYGCVGDCPSIHQLRRAFHSNTSKTT